MKIDKNGVIIDSITHADRSVLGDSYVVMWDNDGILIHVDKSVINQLYQYMVNQENTATPFV